MYKHLTTAFVTCILVSILWGIALVKEQSIVITQSNLLAEKDQSIDKLQNKLEFMEMENNNFQNRVEYLEDYEFKYNLLEEIEEQNNLIVSTKVIDAIFQTSKERKYDIPFLLAWGDVEATLRSNPRKERKVKGILQVDYYIWRDYFNLQKDKMGEPYYNINIGIDILEHYLEMADGDLSKALFYYNNGPSGIYNNQKYVPKIFKKEDKYKQIVNLVTSEIGS